MQSGRLIKAQINDRDVRCERGITILDACHSIGISVPTLCNDRRLKPIGSCRMCLVEVKGKPHPVTACNNILADGMVISTHTSSLEQQRYVLLRMLAKDHPADSFRQCPTKDFERLALEYGLSEKDFDGRHRAELIDDSHPYIHADMSQCILCYRCVRICGETQGQFVWQILNRGHETRIVADSRKRLIDSSCVACGACVDTCPTGALEDKSVLERGVATSWTTTTCSYCGIGCEMNVGTKNNQIVSIRPLIEAEVSKGHLCVKGRYAFDYVTAKDRLTSPMIREGNEWHPVPWEQAISFAAKRLQEISKTHGPDSIAVLGSARATNEENYLTQKFARLVFGTNNVDCCARVCHAPTAAAMKLMLGTGAATNSYNDLERAQTILLCGTNTTENHPIIGARIKQAALRGANLIVIDPRRIELARYANLHLQCRPGTNIPLLNAIANVIVTEKMADISFLTGRVSGWDQYRDFITQFSPEDVETTCGVKADLIYATARQYAKNKPAICFHGLGVTEHTQGTEGVMCLVNLALLTGNIGKPGTGVNPLRGQNNVQGAAHMGCDPDFLTGSVSIHDAKELFQRVWNAPVPPTRGLNMLEMMDAARERSLKALWVIGYDIALTNPNAAFTERALRSLDFVVVQDIFLNETMHQVGDVFLPAASSFEREGTFMNAERRIQRIRKILDSPGQAKPDWQIICALATAMGKGASFRYGSAEDIWNEIRLVWPAGRGISYERLEHNGLQWPCPVEEHQGSEVLHTAGFPNMKRAALQCVRYEATEEQLSEEFPFILITGRRLYQFNAGTMTMRTKNRELRPRDVLEMSVEDAATLKVKTGDRVLIRSRYGKATLALDVTDTLKRGELFATFHTAQSFINRVTSCLHDRYVKTPEYKITAVSISRLTP